MPTYEYRCPTCGLFEVQQRITEDALETCPTCGSSVTRLISRNVNILFKGPGFHITDYRNDKRSKSGDGESNGSSSETSTAASTTDG